MRLVRLPLCDGRLWQRYCVHSAAVCSAASKAVFANTKPVTKHQPAEDYLYEGYLPTMFFQKSLPRLPLPNLADTKRRFLDAIEPIIYDEVDFQQAQELVNTNEIQSLDALLRQRDQLNKHTSYISAAWFNMYLAERRSIVLNHNPFMMFQAETRPDYKPQLVRAANMTISTLRFMKTLRAGVLEPDMYHMNPSQSNSVQFRKRVRLLPQAVSFYGAYMHKVFPLDMSQYERLFCSTRIPLPEKDKLYTQSKARHVLVIRRGHLFALPVLDDNGRIVSAKQLLHSLQAICSQTVEPAAWPIGVFTGLPRADWAQVREKLQRQAGNEEALELVDSAIFCLALDDIATEDPIALSHSFLHSDGTNRWFDKSFQLIVNGDGHAAVNFEHAWGDGVAVLRWFEDSLRDSTEQPRLSAADLADPAAVPDAKFRPIEFRLDDSLKEDSKRASQWFKEHVGRVSMNYFKTDSVGRRWCRDRKIGADAIVQLAFQLAHFQLFGKCAATYESCSTAAFKHGRTETVRPCSRISRTICEHLYGAAKAQSSLATLQAMMRDYSDHHGQLIKEAAMGQGFDRHLFAIKHEALTLKRPVPPLFDCKAYHLVNHNVLSTSTLSSDSLMLGGFAPVVHDGFGIGYSIRDNETGANISTYSGSSKLSDFIDAIRIGLRSIVEVMEHGAAASASPSAKH